MKETCPDGEKILLFLAGELSAADAGGMEAHIGSCSVCRKSASALRGAMSALLRARSLGAPASGVERAAGHPGGECPGDETLAAYVDGALSGDAAAAIESHLAGCSSCVSEVADLWALMGPPDKDAPDSAVESAISRLEAEARTAVVRWAKRSLEVVRGFTSGLFEEMGESARPSLEPAAAYARSAAREATLRWRGNGGVELVGVVRDESGAVSLTGRLTSGGVPAGTASVALSSGAGSRGPESLDSDGRFGPWILGAGDNVLRLTGLPDEGGSATELVVRLERAEGQEG